MAEPSKVCDKSPIGNCGSRRLAEPLCTGFQPISCISRGSRGCVGLKPLILDEIWWTFHADQEPCEEASKCKPNSAKPEQLAPSAQPRSHA